MGIGAIARDHDGGVLAMMSETMEYIHNPLTAKALAAKRVLKFSHLLGIRKIILEGNAKQITQALRSHDGGRCSYGLIIEDMQQIFQSFQEHTVNFVRREANGEAHRLAKLPLALGKNKIWMDAFPFSLNNDVTVD